MRTAMPAGFRRSIASGLILPEPVSRVRQVWTKDEWRLLERATKLLKSKGISIQLRCDDPACKESPLKPERLGDGSFKLTCEHADRVMVHAF